MAVGDVAPGGLVSAILMALATHMLLDLVPHWDYTRTRRHLLWGSLDVLATLIVSYVAYRHLAFPPKVLLCGVVSAVPDLDVLDDLLPWRTRTRWFPSHWAGYPHGTAEPLPGVVTQLIVVAVSAALLVR